MTPAVSETEIVAADVCPVVAVHDSELIARDYRRIALPVVRNDCLIVVTESLAVLLEGQRLAPVDHVLRRANLHVICDYPFFRRFPVRGGRHPIAPQFL